VAIEKTILFGSIYSFHIEHYDTCSMTHVISDIVPMCNNKFIIVLQKFASVLFLSLMGLVPYQLISSTEPYKSAA
jgi:hypothetical protein